MSTKARGKLTLERVLGLSTCSNAGLSVNRVTGDIAYPAGCVVVMYNFQRDKQTRYYRVEKPVSSIAFSVDGALLAIAEKGQAPSITVWDVETGQLKAEFKRHKYGVIAMAFSADSRFLVSMGLVHDKMLYAWDLSTNAVVGGAVVEDKIYAVDFSADGRFFVTVGYRHVHFWPLDDDNMFRVTGKVVADPPLVELASTPATMSRLADATFVDVGCGASSKTVALTADGFLCCFGGTVMERLVSLQASRGFAMSVSADVVAVAGAAATIRLFDPSTLEYKQTLPFPPSHGRMNDRDQFTAAFLTPPHPDEYAAAVAVRVVDATHVVAVYADHTLVVIERSTGTVRRTFFFHHGAVTDLQLVGRVLGVDARGRPHLSKTSNAPDGTFVTCSDDKTIRFWHLDRHKKSPPHTTWVNPYCPELLHVVYAHGATPSTSPLPPAVIDMHNPKDTADTRDGLKCVAVSDRTVAVGSNDGAIHVVQLDWPAMPQRILDKAHASAVLTVAYSPSGELLASGGRDRLTHVHDAAHIRTKTLENHSGAVVAVQFTADGKRLISAGADHNLVFTQVSEHRIFRYNSFPVQGGKLHAMAVVDNDYVLTCVNTWVDVHTLISNKHVQTHHVGEHHRVALSPGAALVALGGSSHDKCIYIVDFHSGEVLAKAAGHGDAVTGLQFTLDGRRLVSTSNDGCIFVWRLSDDLQSAFKAKLRPVAQTMEPPPAPPLVLKVVAPALSVISPNSGTAAPVQHIEPTAAGGVLPPPPPPLLPPPPPASKLPLPAKPQPIKPPVVNAAVENELKEWLAARNHHTKMDEPTSNLVETDDVGSGAGPSLLNKELVPHWARTFRQPPPPASDAATSSLEDGGPRAPGGKWSVNATPDPLKHEIAVKTNDDEAPPRPPTTHPPVSLGEMSKAVPNWARTIRQPKSPKTNAPTSQTKWGAHGVVDSIALCDDDNVSSSSDDDDDDVLEMSETLYIKQSNGELHQVEVPLPPTAASALLPTSSWSLAHERDLLKKKKKQQETANAVADMQAKLGLLGILKPKPPTPVTLGQHNTVDNEGAAHGALELAKSPVHASIVAGYAAELEPETKYNSPDGSVEPRGSRTSNSKNGAAHSPVDVSVQQNVVSDANQQPFGHVVSEDKADAVQAKPPPGHQPRDDDANRTIASTTKAKSSVDQIVDVQRSLSHFVSGYRPPQQQPKAPTTTTGNGSTLVTSFDTSSTLGVDASLSQFTSGYNRSPKARPSVDVPVDMSLSQFVSGFHPTEHAPGEPATVVQQISTTTTPREQDSVDGTPVDMSLSHFVSGFHPDQTRTAPTDQHSSAVLPIIMEQQSIIVDETSTPLDMSLSQFVSGYEHAATPPSPPPALVVLPPASTIQPSVIDWTSDNLSLSHFVLGYSSPQEESNSSQAQSKDLRPVLLQDHNATTGPHVSVDCTTPVDASLGQFVTGYYGRQVSAEHDDDVDLHHVLVAADVDNLCPRDSLEQQSIETASEPHSASSSFDDDDNDHAFSKDVSLSQYISGYRSSVELIPVDMSLSHFTCGYTSQVTRGAPRDPPILEDHNRSVESNSSVIKASVDSDDSSSPQHLEGLHHTSQMMAVESDASRDKDNLVTISVNEPAVAACSTLIEAVHAPPPIKTIVRSLRHLEVNLETTVRQLDAIRPGDDADVDEIVALAATLRSKIAHYAEKTH